MEDKVVELLNFFKALADANRLKIIGLLAQDEYTVEQMAELLNLRPSTVSHHLTKLSKSGLVSARSESYYNIYRLETKALEEMSQRLLAQETLPAVTAEIDMDAYDRKIINTFCDNDGRIKHRCCSHFDTNSHSLGNRSGYRSTPHCDGHCNCCFDGLCTTHRNSSIHNCLQHREG